MADIHEDAAVDRLHNLAERICKGNEWETRAYTFCEASLLKLGRKSELKRVQEKRGETTFVGSTIRALLRSGMTEKDVAGAIRLLFT